MRAYEPPNGMPLAVFQSKYSRYKEDGKLQTFAERIREVVEGNFLFDRDAPWEDFQHTLELAEAGIMPFAGRHLQHGDLNQLDRRIELHANCATAMFSFMAVRLLLRGSGVGRDYSAASCRVNWDNMPDVRLVLNESHPDFKYDLFRGNLQPLREARHMYDPDSERVRWFTVEDSREGWSKVVEILETAAWQEKHKDKLFIFDFTPVRQAGAPIRGIQGKPASGPLSIMNAIERISHIKGAGMVPWKQALFVDHFLAECVQFGGVRRSARMSTKIWRDRDVIEFIDVKRGGFLWSSNNSILVDKEFWESAKNPRPSHARRVFEAAVAAAYWDKTGEPGFINVDLLPDNREGLDKITGETCINRTVYHDLHPRTMDMIDNVLDHVKQSQYAMICNPCQPAFAPLLTPDGIKTLGQIETGDTVWSEDGWVQVVRKWSTGTKPVYRYRTNASVFYGTKEHRIVEFNEKIEVGEADAIDKLTGPIVEKIDFDVMTIMDGLMIGDGSVHMASAEKIYLTIGQDDQDYFVSEIAELIVSPHAVKYENAYKVKTRVTPEELPRIPDRIIPLRYVFANANVTASFLRGLYSANGSVVGDTGKGRVTLKTTSPKLVEQVQMMLSALGISSYYSTNRPTKIEWDNGTYISRESYDINITNKDLSKFNNCIGFIQHYKTEKLMKHLSWISKKPRKVFKTAFDISSVDEMGEMEVFDIEVSGSSHTYWSGACNVSNCAEISIAKWGGLCILGEIALSHVDTLEEALRAGPLMAKFLIRVNRMKAEYGAEVARTNRIGVGITGVHEFAWKHFRLGFRDLLKDDGHSHNFWTFIDTLRQMTEDEAAHYAKSIGMNVPHTVTCVKPSGSISKVMACTEGVHLPALAHYLRWVQYKHEDADLAILRARGYPVKDVSHRYPGYVVVGFPTKLAIVDLMGDHVVTASEATPAEQYRWIQLLEKYWLGGPGKNNMVSYTLKYDSNEVSYTDFMQMMLDYQPTIRCCSVMPASDWRESERIYSYVPEQPLTKEEYEHLMASIKPVVREGYDADELACEAGICPVEDDQRKLGVMDE